MATKNTWQSKQHVKDVAISVTNMILPTLQLNKRSISIILRKCISKYSWHVEMQFIIWAAKSILGSNRQVMIAYWHKHAPDILRGYCKRDIKLKTECHMMTSSNGNIFRVTGHRAHYDVTVMINLMMPSSLSSPVALDVVMMTTSGATSNDKVGIMTTYGFECNCHDAIIYALESDFCAQINP